MSKKFVRLALSGDIPKQDDIIHTSRCNVLASGMEIEGHDRLFMSFERSDEGRVLFVMHECIFKL